MPTSANITTSGVTAFTLPVGAFGVRVVNESDTTIRRLLGQPAGTSGASLGIPLAAGAQETLVFDQPLKNPLALCAIHEGIGNKTLTYEFITQPTLGSAGPHASAATGASSTAAVIVTGDSTLLANRHHLISMVDDLTLALPAAPEEGTEIFISQSEDSWSGILTIDRNGKTINGDASDLSYLSPGFGRGVLRFIWSDALDTWTASTVYDSALNATLFAPAVHTHALTIGSTVVSGAANGDILISNGTQLQKLTPGTGVSAALAAALDGTGGLASKAYADALVVGLLDDRGNHDASGNVFPSSGGSGTAGAILKGDLWTISVAGTLGGHAVTTGDVIRALADTPGQTDSNWVITENNLGYVPVNSAGTLALGGFSSITGTLAVANGGTGITAFGTGVATALGNNTNASGGLLTYGIIGTSGAKLGLLNTANTWSAAQINSVAGAASTPAMTYTGSWFTGGSATTTKPQLLIEPTGATSTAWSTSGTGLGINAPSGFTGYLIEAQLNGARKFFVDRLGNVGLAAGAGLSCDNIGLNINTGYFQFGGRGYLQYSADGVLNLFNNAGTGFNRLTFGGVTSSFPSLKRSTTEIQCRLADDSTYAGFDASAYKVGGVAGASGTGTVISAITVVNGIITSITVS